MNRFVLRQSLLLLLAAVIWGFAFVAQSVGMEYIGPFTFNAVRNLIGGVVLLPCIAFLQKMNRSSVVACKEKSAPEEKEQPAPEHYTAGRGRFGVDKVLLTGGICCGVLLFVSCNLQQIGIQYTTVGKAGFITAMYIVIVPLLGIFWKRKVGARVWMAVAIAVAGLYMLCMTDGSFRFQKGDLLVLACALTFSFHILTIDYFAPKVDGVKMSCIQFFVCGILSAICMFLWEEPDFYMVLKAWLPVLYAGVLSCGVAYTLQIIGQRGMNPTAASLILSLESVISAIAGWAILEQEFSGREIWGCICMFGAIVLVQLPERNTQKKTKA